MTYEIKKAAVLGSGVMGSAIAAHLSGCGIQVLMLDIVPFDNMLTPEEKARKDSDPKIRNKLAQQSLDAALKVKKPTPVFFSPKDADLITLGNFDDDLPKIKDCDWIIEVVVERMDIKQQLLAKVAKHRKKSCIVSSNTSGLSIQKMVEGLPEEFQQHWLGTHFFNPVRHMKLLELIPHPKTKPEVKAFMASFCAETLGKGTIWAKDTPNFIANRIGVHGMMETMRLMVELDYRIDEVDAIVGQPMGRPKTATFKTADLVGLDTLHHILESVYAACADDPVREIFKPPAWFTKVVEKKWLGIKTKGGFYKKDGGRRLVLDWKTCEYIDSQKYKFDSVGDARGMERLEDQVKHIVAADDRAGTFAWKLTAASLCYAAGLIPEISDAIMEVDNGMKWGFNFKMGPFEFWDAIGVRESVARMEKDGFKVPANVKTMLEKGNETFYKEKDGVRSQYDLVSHKYVEIPPDKRIYIIKKFDEDLEVESNSNATLWDIGDGVAMLEFHTKMNALDNEIIEMLETSLDIVADDFKGLVIANQADNFCVGANIFVVMLGAQAKAWDKIEQMEKRWQDAFMRMKYFHKPVVTAPAGMALGGGAEVVMHGQRVQAFAETYMGLVEVGVGLIPGSGGCKEYVLRLTEGIRGGAKPAILPFTMKAFEMAATAKVALGAKEAIDMGILRPTDRISYNRDYHIYDAKQLCLAMAAEGFDPGRPKTDIPAAGENAKAAFLVGIDQMYQAGWATDYDRVVGGKLAHVLAGGAVAEGTPTSEQYYLDLEREAFLSLLGEERTIARIQHMLNTGK
ncbi:MAG: 3-hydroxyacyl-CoA dehydrogenase NAD-binding domain-containing protein, partial [Polyangia bacterium]|nr:3-hydroxyacyl-CoA dehydrogenase NAD-binding domain-containing protein [Polyangia bacterium]